MTIFRKLWCRLFTRKHTRASTRRDTDRVKVANEYRRRVIAEHREDCGRLCARPRKGFHGPESL